MPLTLPNSTTILYVPCNESAGTALNDLASPAHPLTIVGGATSFTAAGPGGNRNALIVSPLVTIYNQTPLSKADTAAFLAGPVSLMIWLNPSGYPDPAGNPGVVFAFEAGDGLSSSDPFIVELLPDGRVQATLDGTVAGGATSFVVSTHTIPLNAWTSVGFDYDRPNDQARFVVGAQIEAWQPVSPNTLGGLPGSVGTFILSGEAGGGTSDYQGGIALVLLNAQIWYEEAHIQWDALDISAPPPNGGSVSVTLTSVYPNLTYTLKAAGVTGSLELLRWTISPNALTSTYLPDSLLSILSARLAAVVATIAPGDIGAMHAILLPLLSAWDLAGNGLVLSAGSGAGYVTLNLGTFDSTTAYVALSVPHSTTPYAT